MPWHSTVAWMRRELETRGVGPLLVEQAVAAAEAGEQRVRDEIAARVPDVAWARAGIDGGICIRVRGIVYVADRLDQITHGDGHVLFVCGKTGVIVYPDNRIEEFSIAGGMDFFRMIGGKPFSVRVVEGGKVAAVWNGLVGPSLKEIRHVVASQDGVPVYIGRKDGRCWRQFPEESTKVVVRHPDQILFEGAVADWHSLSKTPEALPVESTVYCTLAHLVSLPDGSVVWGVRHGKDDVSVYRDGHVLVRGDLLAFHCPKDGTPTLIERTPNDGRKIHDLAA